MQKIRKIIIVLIIASIAGYLYWSDVQERSGGERLEASGTIEAIDINVGTKVAGKIVTLNIREGDAIKSGDEIAVIDVPELYAQQRSAQAFENSAKAKADNAKADLDRITELFNNKMASDQQLDNARTTASSLYDNYLQAKASVDIAQVQISNSKILAPISGVVLVKAVEQGELIQSGGTIVTMADLRSLEMKIYIPETKLGKISLGKEVSIRVDSFPKETFTGKVVYISDRSEFTPKNIQTKEERVNQVFAIKIDIPNDSLRLKPGMPADATWSM